MTFTFRQLLMVTAVKQVTDRRLNWSDKEYNIVLYYTVDKNWLIILYFYYTVFSDFDVYFYQRRKQLKFKLKMIISSEKSVLRYDCLIRAIIVESSL